MCCVWVVCVSGTLTQKDAFVRDYCFEVAPISWADRELQSRAEVRAIFLNVDKPLAEKSPRPGHSRVTAIHQNTRGLPSFEGYKVPL